VARPHGQRVNWPAGCSFAGTNMKFPQLIATVRDPMNSIKVEQAFLRSPVTVGRAEDNALRLDSRIVSRHHGAFFFGQGGLHYVDVGSANGSFVDGRSVVANGLVEIGNSTVLTIGPFQISVDLRLVNLPRFPSDPRARTSIDLNPSAARSPAADPGAGNASIDERLLDAIRERGPIGALRQALRVADVVAALLVAFRSGNEAASPVESAKDSSAIVRYLMEDGATEDRIGELRGVLAGLLRAGRSARGPALVITPQDGEA
jgi:pSer/pThr/pTyr-binding forkhead associated (FHA) protein